MAFIKCSRGLGSGFVHYEFVEKNRDSGKSG